MKRLFQNRPSYITITVLILMLVLVAITYLFADALFGELAIARNNKGAQVAFSLAEAGTQEAIYRVQYDTTARNTFLNTTTGVTTFTHDPALIGPGAYSVTIQNSAKGVATITSIGTYTMGTRIARREIKVGIAQATQPPAYPYDGAIFGAGGAGESIADIDFWYASVNIYGGSILSNRDINFKFGADVNIEKSVEAGRDVTVNWPSHVDCNCLINDDGDPETPQCSTSPGCAPVEGAATKSMPQIDFDSSSPNSYKNQAISQGHYFSRQQDFKTDAIFPKWSERTFEGIYYIDSPLDIDWGRTMRMNGVIATSGSISVSFGQLLLAPPTGGGPSGALTQGSLTVGTIGNFSGTGLVYTGDRFQIDASIPYNMNLTGGILSRRTWISGFRTTNIYLDADVINAVLATPSDTPVIEINHWEEEY